MKRLFEHLGLTRPPSAETSSAANQFGSAMVLSMAVLFVGTVLTLWGTQRLQRSIEAQAQERFDLLSARVQRDIVRRMTLPAFGLRGAIGVQDASDPLSRQAFRAYVSALDIDKQFPGVRGFGYIERVMRQDLGRFVAHTRADQAPDFAVNTQGDAPDLYVIKFLEPVQRNRAALGFDIGSEAVRRQAIEHAIRTGEPTLSHRITLLQDNRRRPGLLYFIPSYRPGAHVTTPTERLNALRGVHYAPIVLDEILQGLHEIGEKKIDIVIREQGDDHASAAPLYASGADRLDNTQASFFDTRELRIGNQLWTLQVASNALFVQQIDHSAPAWITTGGLLLSLMLSLAMWLLASGRVRAESLAASMTADLDRLAQVVRLTSNAVIITDRDLRITWVNEGFTQLYGHRIEEALGQTPGTLLGSPDTAPEALRTLAEAAQAGVACRAEVINRTRDGRRLWIDTEVQPIHDRIGQVTGFIEIAQNVTTLKETSLKLEAAMRDTEALLRTLNQHAIVSEADPAGRITAVNDAFCQISGYAREELIGQTHQIVNSGHHDRAFWSSMWQTISAGQAWHGEICNRTKHGSIYWVDSIIAPFTRTDGRIEKYISIRTDITQRKLAEQKLRDSEAFLDRAGRVAGIGAWQYDLKTGQLYWSAQNCRIHDRDPALPITLEESMSHLSEAGREQILQAGQEAMISGLPWDMEIPVTTASGRAIWLRSVGEVVRENGVPVRLVGASQDITVRRQERMQLTQTTSLLRNVLNAASEVSIIATDVNLLITVFNTGAEQLLGYSAAEMIGLQTPAKFHDPDEVRSRAQALSDQLGRPIEGAQIFQEAALHGRPQEWTYVRRDGHRLTVSLVVTAQRSEQGEVIGYLGVAHDVTQRQHYEASLRQAMQHAEQASLAKSQFLANMSHEIRTPMNAILGMLKLLSRTPLDARQKDYAAKTEGAARSLLSLLNDILDFSKVEAGKMILDQRPFEVEQLLRDLAVILSASLGAKPIELLFAVDPDVPAVLMGDDMRLQQVLINLAGNAIKFTSQGEVVLRLQCVSRNEQRVTLRVAVEDTGIGIAPEALDTIFEGFSQAEASTTRRFGGTGLGLAISQRLVAMMGGQLTVHSTLGQGSVFSFDVVLAPVQDNDRPVPARTAPRHRVLIVDDNATARQVLSSQMATLNWQCDVADSGRAALALIQASEERGVPYDAVFVDWNMPGMDGWETSARIRQRNPLSPAPLIVMVTAHDRETLAQRSQQEQALLHAFLVKPVTPGMLIDSLQSLGSTPIPPPGSHLPRPLAAPPRLQDIHILLAEDNPNNQQVASELLSDEGAIITIADDGLHALTQVLARHPSIDVILMDMQMPVMDGLTATARIIDALGEQAPPIIAMTANALPADREACLAAGMVDHVGKPFDLETLVSSVRRHSRRPPLHGMTGEATAQDTTTGVAHLASRHGMKLADALARLGGRQDVYLRLLHSFIQDLESGEARLSGWWQADDRRALAPWLHTTKGLAATLGHQALASALADAEAAMRSAPQGLLDSDTGQHTLQAVTQARQTLRQLHQELASITSASPPPADVRADPAALAQALRELTGLLQHADMSAVDVYTRIQQSYAAVLGPDLAPLDAAMAQLDFPLAVRLCRQWLAHHDAQESA